MKYLLFDAANTLIYKPNLWERILKVLQDNGYKISETELKLRHKLFSEIINFPDTTSRDFYEEFNSELLMALGIIPDENLLKELFEACSYLPWQAFDDCEEIKKLDIKNLTETDKTIINTIINNPEMSQKQIADNLNWTVNKVKYYMKKFKQKNILRYEGTSQNGKWEIQEENLKYFLK